MAATKAGKTGRAADAIPRWVPEGARHYLAHTEQGLTIRALARRADVHASTILRQVRRFEALRDDPLVDRALRRLSQHCGTDPGQVPGQFIGEWTGMKAARNDVTMPDIEEIEREGLRILRRLAEPGTVLAVARDMEMGVVVRDCGDGGPPQRLAVMDRSVAEAMALNDWIACESPDARVARYRVTASGRSALKRLVAQAENRARGFAEAQTTITGLSESEDPQLRHMRTMLAESPLVGLARRHDRDGQPFLNRDLVAAAERLREDFELSQPGHGIRTDWETFLTAALGGDCRLPAGSPGTEEARARLCTALRDLGPGLADVAMRCCCLLEGLESLERRMGWSARSGKIVLRIALQRLRQHYLRTQGQFAPMIG